MKTEHSYLPKLSTPNCRKLSIVTYRLHLVMLLICKDIDIGLY